MVDFCVCGFWTFWLLISMNKVELMRPMFNIISHLLSSDFDQTASLKPSVFICVFVCLWIKCSLWIDLKSAKIFPRFIVQYVTGPCRCSVILPTNTDTCGLQFLCSSDPSLWQNWCEHCNCQLDQFHCQQLLLAKNTILFQA